MREYNAEQINISCDLGRWVERRRLAENMIGEQVNCARAAGMSWAMVGLALGVSAQAAWEKYGLTAQQRAERALAAAPKFDQPELPVE